MIERLRVENFQSIEHADLELGPLTVLVGPGRSGKSALLRALRCLITNKATDGYIRHGAKSTKVSVVCEGKEVVWKKGRGKGGVYELEGQTYTKTGGEVPDGVRSVLLLHPLAVDSSLTVFVQLQDQHDPPFLLSESGARQTKIIGTLTKLDAIVRAQQRAATEAQRAQRAAGEEERKVKEYEQALARLPDVAKARAVYRQAIEKKETYENTTRTLAFVKEVREATRPLQQADPTPAIEQAQELEATIERLSLLVHKRRELDDARFVEEEARADLDYAERAVSEHETVYKQALEERGVCDTCPLREDML